MDPRTHRSSIGQTSCNINLQIKFHQNLECSKIKKLSYKLVLLVSHICVCQRDKKKFIVTTPSENIWWLFFLFVSFTFDIDLCTAFNETFSDSNLISVSLADGPVCPGNFCGEI